MTLHFLTIHHHASRWIKPQVLHIHSYCSNFKIWSIFSEIDITKYKPLFFFLQEAKGNEQGHSEQDANYASQQHWQSLNELTKIVCKHSSVKDEDIIIWIDSDTLILKQINNYLTDKLNEYDFCSIQRPENGGDLIPHPSFAFCRVGFARNYNITWEGYLKDNPPVDQKFEGLPSSKTMINSSVSIHFIQITFIEIYNFIFPNYILKYIHKNNMIVIKVS